MAINAYTGLMGSGKSYEVVENVILPALLAGRRVVTNVANLQQDEIRAYLVEKFHALPDKIGDIVQVTNDQISSPLFFPVEVKQGEPVSPSIVQGGDLIVTDECWRWWSSGSKITPEHMTFFRMHRHFINPETKVSCDMVLVVQDIGDLDRKLKVVVENTYRMTKHKALGTSKRYRVDVYSGYKVTASATRLRELQRTYNPEIFKLYQSYSQGAGESGKEVAIDDRSNIFKGLLFRVVLPLMLVLFVFSVWRLWLFFHPSPVVNAVTDKSPKSSAPAGAVAVPFVPSDSDWRVTGDYRFAQNHYVTITRGDSVRTLINPKQFYFDALRAYGSLDGQVLTNYTGSEAAQGGILPGQKK
jgi:zona occludens toxin